MAGQDLVEVPEALKPYIPQFKYYLYDMSGVSDAEIVGQVYQQARLLLMKYILRDELAEKIEEIFGLFEDLGEAETSMEHIKVMIQYVLGGAKREKKAVLVEKIKQTLKRGELMTTIAEALIEEGEIKGIKKGKVEGEAQGLRKSLRHIFSYMYGVELDHFDEGLQHLDTAALEQVQEVVFKLENVAQLEDLLGSLRPIVEVEV